VRKGGAIARRAHAVEERTMRALREVAKPLGIAVHDHIIVGRAATPV